MAKTGEPSAPQCTTFQCSCGKQLSAPLEYLGKTVKCPLCGSSPVVPGATPTTAAFNSPIEKSDGLSRVALVGICSAVGWFAIGCVLLFFWHARSVEHKRIVAANESVANAVASANRWLADPSTSDGNTVERELRLALAEENATDTIQGQAVLKQVQQQIIERAKRRSAAQQLAAKRRAVASSKRYNPGDLREIAGSFDRHVGENFVLMGLLYPKQTVENREHHCFTIAFKCNDHQVSGGPYRDKLSFVMTRGLAQTVSTLESALPCQASVYVQLRYLNESAKEYPVGYVTTIELASPGSPLYSGGVLTEHGVGVLSPKKPLPNVDPHAIPRSRHR